MLFQALHSLEVISLLFHLSVLFFFFSRSKVFFLNLMANEMLDIIQSPAEKDHFLSIASPALRLRGSLLLVRT